MALREIGAKLTLDGEAEWNKQMKAADRELANLKSELAATSAEFSGQANTVEALRAKQQLQAQQAQQQREKVQALARAVADATEKWGAESTQVDKLTQKYNYSRAALANMESNLEETSDLLDEAEASADGCATSIDGYGKKVKAAAAPTEKTAGKVEELSDAEQDAQGGAGKLLAGIQKLVPQLNAANIASKLTAAGIAGGLVKGFKQAFDWAMNLVESTAELRQGLTQLEVAAGAAGLSLDSDMTEAMKVVYEASGDMNTAIKTVSDLLQAGYSGSGMVETLEQLRGAVIAFPDTLKIDSLAEGLQKTLATGAADGQFKDMLERLGVDVDDLAASLDACSTSAEKQQTVLSALAGTDLADLTAEYDAASEASRALADAQFELEMANARLAESFEPFAVMYAEMKSGFFSWLADRFTAIRMGDGGTGMAQTYLNAANAAGADMTMQEFAELLETENKELGELYEAAADAGMSVGEFINQLHAKQVQEAADAAADLAAKQEEDAETARKAAEAQKEALDALDATNDSVQEAVGQLAELQAKYEGIRSSVDSVVTGFNTLVDVTSIEVDPKYADGILDALQSQIDYMAAYEENLQVLKDKGLSDALIEEFSDGSTESAEALHQLAFASEEEIAAINEKFAEVSAGKDAFVDTIAEALPGFTETIDAITETLNGAVEDWNQNEAAHDAGVDTIDGLKTGLDQYDEIFALGQQMGQAFEAGYKSALDQHSPSRTMRKDALDTVAGAMLGFRSELPAMEEMGGDLGESFLRGYQRAAAILHAETGGAAQSAAAAAQSEVVGLLKAYLPGIQDVAKRPVVLDSGELVSATAGRMDEALGGRYINEDRGLAQ